MEGTDFRGALLRGWRLMLVAAILGALIGLVLPTSSVGPKKTTNYVSSTVVTVSGSKGGVTLTTLAYDATSPNVMSLAASQVGIKAPAGVLPMIFAVASAQKVVGKGVKLPAISLIAIGPGAVAAANRANAYAAALGSYEEQQINNAYQLNLCKAQQNVSNLQDQLSTIDDDIQTEESGGTVDVSNLPTPTTFDPTQCSNSGSNSTTAARSGAPRLPGAVLDDSSTDASTTTSQPNSSTATTAPPSSTTTTTVPKSAAKSDPVLALLESQQQAATSELNSYVAQLTQLTLTGPPSSGYSVLVPASRYSALADVPKHSAVSSSLFTHSYMKALLGLIVGSLLAGGIVVLVEATDKSLRSVSRAEEAFGFPVVAEVPMWPATSSGKQVGPPASARLDVVFAPGSPVAEAYRRLRTAVALEPLAAEVVARLNGARSLNGYGSSFAYGNGEALGAGPALAAAYESHVPEDHLSNGHRNGKRQVVFVVSPGREPTRPAVVANLAAAFAEGGGKVLVLSVGQFSGRPADSQWVHLPERGEELQGSDIAPMATKTAVEGVSGLTFDNLLANRAQLVTHGPAVIGAARQLADVVIVEGPPLLRAHDALGLLTCVDVVLVVAEFATTTFDNAKKAGALLRRYEAPVLGIAMTNVRKNVKDLEKAALTTPALPLVSIHPEAPTAELRR